MIDLMDGELAPPGREPAADGTDWELIVESRVRRVRADLAHLGLDGPDRAAAEESLGVAESVLATRTRWWRALPAWWTGWRVERAWRALHEAEVYVMALDPDLAAHLPALCERVVPCLPEADRRRRALEELHPAEPPTRADRAVVVDAVRAAFDASDEAHAAARALRNKLSMAVLVLVLLNLVLGLVGRLDPGFLPMCVARPDAPARLMCASGGGVPAPGDLWLVQVMGAVGAVIVSVVVFVLRRPSLSPYTLAGYQALIKVLLGALLAVVGVLALGAGVGEGLVGPRTQAALLVAAVVFGYAQQLGTRLLDDYADRLLDRVRPLTRSGDDGDRSV